MKCIVCIFFINILFGIELRAESETASKNTKTAVLNFEDELIKGQNTKPELFYLLQQKNFNYKRLIKLRENFIPEAKKSFENLNSNRGNN